MPQGKIDYDRGVIIRSHTTTGMDVFMYVDTPGEYLTAHGTPVPDTIAKEAGYDVDILSKEKLKRERKQAAMDAIDKELNNEKDVSEEVVEEKNGFKVVSIGLGRHHILVPEGNRLSTNVLPLDMALKVMNAMADPVPKKKG